MRGEEAADIHAQVGALLGQLGGVLFRVDPETLGVTLEGAGEGLTFWGQLVAEQERERVAGLLRAVASDGLPRVLEHAGHLPGREDVLLRTAVRRTHAPGGAPGPLLGAMLDISQERAHERQWREVEAWLAALGESLPFDFWICDRLGRVVLQNPVSTRHWGNMLGLGPEQVPLPADARAAWQHSHARALAGEVVREELELHVGGEPRSVARVVAPVRQDGQVCGSLGVDTDVTLLKRAEQRLRQSLEELHRAQAGLVQREQLAALGEMAAVVAHEVRNPLGAMFNVIALLRRERTRGEAGLELLAILEEESQRLDELVTHLLELVRPQPAVLRVQPLWPVVEEALTHGLRTAGGGRPIPRVERTVDSTLEVALDARLLGLALLHGVRAAVQALPEGAALAVEVRAGEGADAHWVRIAVGQAGAGARGGTGHGPVRPPAPQRTGSGISLSIIQRAVAEHHGRLEAQGEPGPGADFALLLPRAPGQDGRG